MSDYMEDVSIYSPDASEAAVAAIVKYLGVALRSRDSSLVSCTDSKELDRIRDGYCRKKLGLETTVAEKAIKSVCEKMSDDRTKHRVTFYYLLAEETGSVSKLA